MVFRHLQLETLVRIAALGLCLAGSACDSSSTSASVAIQMELDPQTCPFDSSQVALSCQSTAVVSVRGEFGTQIASDCAILSPGSLAGAAALIEDTLDLGSLPSDVPLTIGLAVYSGVLQPCPTLSAGTSPFLFGLTTIVTLGELTGPIALPLQCDTLVDPDPNPPSGGTCSECDGDLRFCLDSNGLDSCQSMIFNCQSTCDNTSEFERCLVSCSLLEWYCSSPSDQSGEGVTLNCSQDENACIASCEDGQPNEPCATACSDAAQKCSGYQAILGQCESQYQGCTSECGSSCLSPAI